MADNDKDTLIPRRSYDDSEVGEWTVPATADFKAFRDECLSDDGFVEAHAAKDFGLKVWTKKMDNSAIQVVRVHATFDDVDPDVLYDVLHDHAYRQTWDENMMEGYIVEMIKKDVEVGYYSAKSPAFGVANRDFCNMRAWKVFKKKGEKIIFNFSVKHKDCPEKKGFVRGWSFRTGYFIQKKEGGGTVFRYYTQNDPRGWLPAFLVNTIVSKFAPTIITKLRTVALAYGAWKADNKPDHKPWLQKEKREKKKKPAADE
jgi:hypothetical protein